MKSSIFRFLPAWLCLLVVARTSAQTVEFVIVSKGSSWVQTSAGAPILDPRPLSPTYGGPVSAHIEVSGVNLAAITPPVVTLAPGSLYPIQNPFRHNGGVLFYRTDDEAWQYGVEGNGYGSTSEAARDLSFANGIYTFNALGSSVNLNLAATAFDATTPQITLNGGTWSGGKYYIEVAQPLTITTSAFANYDRNANGVVQLELHEANGPEVFGRIQAHAPMPLGIPTVPDSNFILETVPTGTLTPGRVYNGEAFFAAVMDQVAGAPGTALENSLNVAIRERSTAFTVIAYSCVFPQLSIRGVGDIPGGVARSTIRDVTRVGGVIYGVGAGTAGSGTTVDRGILWTSTGGLTALPDLVPNTSTSSIEAVAVTPDGAFAASRAHSGSLPADRRAVRVTTGTLSNLVLDTTSSNPQLSMVNTISDDGSVLYGVVNGPAGRPQAARFTAAGPTVTALPFLNPGDNSSAIPIKAATPDGSVAVGTSTNATSPTPGIGLGNQAFRYVHGVGLSALPYAPGGTWNSALAVSPDGNLVLLRGNSAAVPSGEVYLYNVATATIKSLGTPNVALVPSGLGRMTPDGSAVVVGFGTTGFVWNHKGWSSLNAFLVAAGLDLTGWVLNNFQGMSADGTLICGNGNHFGSTEGYVIELPANYLAQPAPAITSALTASGTYAQPFSYTITANHCPHDFDAVNLPAGLSIDNSTGQISGSAAQAGTFAVTLAATNYHGTSVKELLLTIAPAAATVQLGNLTQGYDGTPRVVTTTTQPAGLPVTVTYNGSTNAPTAIGSYAVVATINDPNYIGSASGTLVVSDATPPTITSLTASSTSLWPANHKMVAITLTGSATDASGPVTLSILSVTSSEADNGLGDGDTANDIQITGAMTLNLRAERSGNGPGRTYTITVEARDAAGNASTKTVLVTVPKNQVGK